MSCSPPLPPRRTPDLSECESYRPSGPNEFERTQASPLEQQGRQQQQISEHRGPPLRYPPDSAPPAPYPSYRVDTTQPAQLHFQQPPPLQHPPLLPPPQRPQHLSYQPYPLQPPAPFSTLDRPPIREAPDFSSPKQQRKTKGHIASACVPCKRAHLRCDAQQPCSRCLSNGKEDACVDVQHKKRGRPRLRDERESRYDGVGPGYPPPEASMRRPLSFHEGQMVSGFGDPLHQSSSYRVLKSQILMPAGVDTSTPGGSMPFMLPQEPICAYLTMEMQIAKATQRLSDTVLLPVVSRKLQDIVDPTDRDKVCRLQRIFEDERREREPNYLPPIYLHKFEEDRAIQSVGFGSEEIGQGRPDHLEILSFLGSDGKRRNFQVRLGLAKKDHTYFIVLILDALPPHPPFSPFPRESHIRYPDHALLGGEVPASVSKSPQHNSDVESPSNTKITTEHLRSPSPIRRPEPQHSHNDPSSDSCDDETDWGEDELSPGSPNISLGNLTEGYKVYGERRPTLGLLLSPTKRQLVQDIMKDFWVVFNREDGDKRTKTVVGESYFQGSSPSQDGSSQQKPGSSSSWTELNPPSQGSRAGKNGGKRRRDSQGSQNDDDGDDPSRKRPRPLFFPPLKEDDNTKFACPYRKHNPHKYCVQYWRTCALTPFETVARVKEHLYRHHRIFPCQRCKVLFQDQQEVNQHLMEPKACEVTGIDQVEGVTSEIVERLRCRKKTYKGQTDEERWIEIYKLLFPNEIAPSPYYEVVQEDIQSPDSRALAEYEEYCRRELPRDFRVSLEEMVHNEGRPFEDNIRSQLMNMIRDCQDRVFSRYRATATPTLQNSTINPRESSPPAVRSSSLQNMDSYAFQPVGNRGNASEALLPDFFEPPAPQAHLTSSLEAMNSNMHVPRPTENNLSDSGYASDIRPHSVPDNSRQNVEVSTSQHNESHPVSEDLFTHHLSSQDSSNVETTVIGTQRSYDLFDSNGDVSNTLDNSWMGDVDTSTMLDGVDWGQFVGTDPALDPPI